MRISMKLPIGVTLIVLFAILATSLAGLYISSGTTRSEIENKLVAIASGKKNEIQQFLLGIDKDITSLASADITRVAIDNLGYEFVLAEEKAKPTFQKRYIQDNPNPADQRHLLDNPDVDVYDNLHAEYHAFFKSVALQYGYEDIMLVDKDGNVVYTVYKQEDFASNLTKGDWENTGLSKAYQLATERSLSDDPVFIDMSAYAVIADAPTAFIAKPVFRGDDRLGAVIVRFPNKIFNSIISAREGLGKTGEVVVLNANNELISNSVHTEADDTLNVTITSPLIDEARNGALVSGFMDGYRNMVAEVVMNPVSYHGTTWVLAALVDKNEAFAAIATMRNWMIGIAIVLLGFAAGLGFWFSRSIVNPIKATIDDMTRLATGDPDFTLTGTERKDEVGDIALAVKVFQDGMIERRRLHVQRDEEIKQQEARAISVQNLIDDFKQSSQDLLVDVQAGSENMHQTSQSMIDVANHSASNIESCESQSGQATENVQNVASAAEELSASINDISRRVEESSRIISVANADTHAANAKIESLEEAAGKIGEVVTLITDIAEQTNLLALNATIEAARAGEAGRGFAVVATEVKSLASQTAKATEEIATQINTIQSSTTDTVQTVKKITDTMNEVLDHAEEISTAMQQQGAATTEISQNIARAAQSTQLLNGTIADVNGQISETKQSADSVLDAANNVTSRSEELRGMIDGFLSKVAQA